MDWGKLGGCKGTFINPVMHEAEDELADEAKDDDDTKDLMGGVPVLGLRAVRMRY